MKFLPLEGEAQFKESHPQLVSALRDFEMWSHKEGLPEPVVVELWRDRQEQSDLYYKLFKEMLGRYRAGVPIPRVYLPKVSGMAQANARDPDVRSAADRQFTWHLVRCAADIRTHFYTQAQHDKVLEWVSQRCPEPLWEVIGEAHGTGAHLHIAYRAFDWRKKFTEESHGKQIRTA